MGALGAADPAGSACYPTDTFLLSFPALRAARIAHRVPGVLRPLVVRFFRVSATGAKIQKFKKIGLGSSNLSLCRLLVTGPNKDKKIGEIQFCLKPALQLLPGASNPSTRSVCQHTNGVPPCRAIHFLCWHPRTSSAMIHPC